MKELREKIIQLERSYDVVRNDLKNFYKAEKERYIRDYIKNNVNQGDIFYMYSSYLHRAIAIEFIEMQDSEIVFQERVDKYEVRTPISRFIYLVRDAI